jgi:ABC-2 type transport system ATP-binding protein
MTTSSSDVIRVENLEKRFGSFVAVDKINFSVKRGEIFGFLGPNGSGKSTTIRMLCGILTPTSGSGYVADHDIFEEPEKIKESIGYMSQRFSLYEDMTPRENIRFYLGIYSVSSDRWEEKMDSILDLTRLYDVSDRLTRELPPSGVDPITRRHFWQFIGQLAEKGVTVFVTTHYMDEARNCERIVMLNEGTIVATGAPDEIVAKTMPGYPEADLNDAFVHLMSRGDQ